MAMGTEAKVVLNNEMQEAKSICTEYRNKIDGLKGQLDSAVNELLKEDSFSGQAANGFKNFYQYNIVGFFTETFDKYIAMFDAQDSGLFDSIEKSLVTGEGVDPALGENNNSIGQSAAPESQN